MSKSVLITGGAGFLGSHLCKFYLDRGDAVICVDNLSTGRKQNIEKFLENSNFTFEEVDITKDLPESIMHKTYDIILNMASPASPPQYQRLAVETLMVGATGMQNMLELAKRDKARFFQASTSEVYGDPEVHPQPESYKGSVNCYGPRAMYDESKRFAEAMTYVYREKYGVNTCIGRFFNTYGPNMDPKDGRVVSNLIVQALQNKPLTVYGDGGQTRSFCYVDDLVLGITKLVDSNEHEPMNLGNPGEFTIKELAEILLEIMPETTSKLIYEPLPKDDPMQRKPVIDRAKKTLGWEPKISLREGLVPTIKYFSTQVAK